MWPGTKMRATGRAGAMLAKASQLCLENGGVAGLYAYDLPPDLAGQVVCTWCARDASGAMTVEMDVSNSLGTSIRAHSLVLCLPLCLNCSTDLIASLKSVK